MQVKFQKFFEKSNPKVATSSLSQNPERKAANGPGKTFQDEEDRLAEEDGKINFKLEIPSMVQSPQSIVCQQPVGGKTSPTG